MAESPTAATPLSRLAIDRSALAAPRRRRPLWKRWWIWALLLALLLAAGLVIRSRGEAQAVEFATVAAAYPSASIAVLNATGRVVAQRRASVSSKGTGRLEWLGVLEGQMVKEGEVIARLENRDVAAQREQAAAQVQAARANLAQGQAELEDAQASLKRAQDLAKQNFISGSALDTAEARYNKARAAIDTLKAQIGVAEANLRVAGVAYDQTLIRAPFTGIVLTKVANVGDIVTPFSAASGTTGAVVTMADMETLEVEADVSESSIAKIRVGQPAEIQLDAFPELRLLGEVSRVVPTVDRSKATLLVKVQFIERDARVLPDMSTKVAFLSRALQPQERKPVPALRADAIVKRDGADVVFVVNEDSTVRPVPVKVGEKVGDLVRVEGVTPGTRVVASPPERLAAGARVEALKK
ncbi:MAG TPA: efflux RND transporter periplasmic adaptor subunit [Burkholderiaceae bacterium]|nr:efflux RND transporter periplasmic adaptor subunit [Burkholderiaceae bacterium]